MNNKFSIIIPAHNEEKYIGKCLGSIKKASQFCQNQVEIIVILNRCHDRTEEIVKKINVKIFKNDRQNLAALRNFGAKQATGDIIITIDADSWMSQNALLDIANRLNTGKYIGGDAQIKFEKINLSVILTIILYSIILFRDFYLKRLTVGLFWCFKKDFDKIGGFNENLISAEDLDFARRLKRYGKKQGKRYGRVDYITTSNRKFGDWYYIRNIKTLLKVKNGKDEEAAQKIYYNYPH